MKILQEHADLLALRCGRKLVISGIAARKKRPEYAPLRWFDNPVAMASDPEMDRLTQREQEVLRLIARGYTYKEVAGRIHVSVKTVETHVSSVLRKLQLSNRHQLTRWATDRRLV